MIFFVQKFEFFFTLCRREAEMKNQMLSQILDQQARARCM